MDKRIAKIHNTTVSRIERALRHFLKLLTLSLAGGFLLAKNKIKENKKILKNI